jgi:NADH-quinone oxidoreductase subunit C
MSDETEATQPEQPEAADTPEPDAPEPEAPELDEQQQALLDRLQAALGDAVVASGQSFGTLIVRVRPDAWRRAAEVARRELGCDFLSFVSAIDWQPATVPGDAAGGDTSSPVQPGEMTFGVTGSEGRFQVFAHVQSTERHYGVTFKTDIAEGAPVVDSWVPVYPGADWHERETWEMFGVAFEGHPSLRHLYLPAEFEGHPLRKDFPLLTREVKPWPGLVDVEAMPGDEGGDE